MSQVSHIIKKMFGFYALKHNERSKVLLEVEFCSESLTEMLYWVSSKVNEDSISNEDLKKEYEYIQGRFFHLLGFIYKHQSELKNQVGKVQEQLKNVYLAKRLHFNEKANKDKTKKQLDDLSSTISSSIQSLINQFAQKKTQIKKDLEYLNEKAA